MTDNDRFDTTSRRKFIAGAGAAGLALAAGCTEGGDGGDGGSDGGDGGDGGSGNLSGDIRISGSSTVYPVATAVGELFQEDHPDVNINLSRDGSSGGFENFFVVGDSDINNSSRPITEEEINTCRDTGFEPVEFKIASDALTIVVNNENDWVDAITYDELETIWNPENPPELWSDVRDDWPDEPFDLYGAASTSGTFDYFTEEILGEAGRIRDDFEGTEEDDQIASGVEGSRYGFGYLPFAYYSNNPDETKALLVTDSDDLDNAVAPSLEAASTGEYPMARPLFFYGNMNRIQEKNHLQEFMRFYIDKSTDNGLIAEQIGYVPASDSLAETNRGSLQAAIDGEYEIDS